MKAIIKEIITHFLVVCVVLIVAYGNHDKRAFNMSNEVKNVLVAGDPDMISFNVVSWIYSFSFSVVKVISLVLNVAGGTREITIGVSR